MKRKFIIAFEFLIISVSCASAKTIGFGFHIGSSVGKEVLDGNIAFTMKSSYIPLVIGAEINFNYRTIFHAGFIADYWFANPVISGNWGWFYGMGLAAGTNLDSEINFAGARAVIGTNMLFFGNLELYLQVALELGMDFTFDSGIVMFPVRHSPVNLGFRFWL